MVQQQKMVLVCWVLPFVIREMEGGQMGEMVGAAIPEMEGVQTETEMAMEAEMVGVEEILVEFVR